MAGPQGPAMGKSESGRLRYGKRLRRGWRDEIRMEPRAPIRDGPAAHVLFEFTQVNHPERTGQAPWRRVASQPNR
jgi:hypothetical protein